MKPRPLSHSFADRRLAVAQAAYDAARFDEALVLLDGCEPVTRAQTLRSTTLCMLGRVHEAVEISRFAVHAASTPHDRIRALLSLTYASLSVEPEHAGAALAMIDADRRELPVELRSEIGFAEAILAYARGDADEQAETSMVEAYRDRSPYAQTRALQLHSYIFAQRGEYRQAFEVLMRALKVNDENPSPNISMLACILRGIAMLVHELPFEVDLADLRARAYALPWTEHTKAYRYWTFRALGLRMGLEGGVGASLGLTLLTRSFEYAGTPAQRALSAFDAAFIGFSHNEPISASSLLEEADRISREVDWAAEVQDERLALIEAAQLFAPVRVDKAAAYLRLFRSLPPMEPTQALAHDRRIEAMLAYADGLTAKFSGETEQAAGHFRAAYDLFRAMSYDWRAAAAAIELEAITGDVFLRLDAQRLIRPYPRSWIAEKLRSKP